MDISKRLPLSGSIVVESCFRVPEGQRTDTVVDLPRSFAVRGTEAPPPLRFPSLKTFPLFVCISCSSFSPGFVTTLSTCVIDKVGFFINFLVSYLLFVARYSQSIHTSVPGRTSDNLNTRKSLHGNDCTRRWDTTDRETAMTDDTASISNPTVMKFPMCLASVTAKERKIISSFARGRRAR